MEQQVEFLHQSQTFMFTASFTSGLPVCLQGFQGQGSQFILRQPVQCWRARIIGKSLIMLDKNAETTELQTMSTSIAFKATESMSIFYPIWQTSKYLNTTIYDILLSFTHSLNWFYLNHHHVPRSIIGSRDTVVNNNNKNKVPHVMELIFTRGCGLYNIQIWNGRWKYMIWRKTKQGKGQRNVIKIEMSGKDSLVDIWVEI